MLIPRDELAHSNELDAIIVLSTSTPLFVAPANDSYTWHRADPTPLMFIAYAFVVPLFSCFGLVANFINAIVFMRPKMTPSAFSYLAVLSWLDCASCLLITLTALSRSVFYNSTSWLRYDFQWQTPLFGMTTGAANLILACVSLDRLVYLWSGVPSTCPPRFCRRKIARRMIVGVIVLSIVVNIPYFFVFIVNDDGTFQTTKFYSSKRYKFHNWFSFALLTVLPAIFLMIGNAAIIIAFRRWTKQGAKCSKNCSSNSKLISKRVQHQIKLTITVLIVITLYLIGELPAHLFSRKSALNLVFGGDVSKVNMELMERIEVIFITLNVIQLSMNIIIYGLINPFFMPEFFTCLRSASDAMFKVFCCTGICNCCHRLCNCSKSQPTEPQPAHAVSNSDNWGAEESSQAAGNFDAIAVCPQLNVKRSTSQDSGGGTVSGGKRLSVDPTASVEKRASSVADFAYINAALELECDAQVTVEEQRRYSITM